jgi:hypothetical protein
MKIPVSTDWLRLSLLAMALVFTNVSTSNADLVAYWNFNNLTAGTTTAAPSNANQTSYSVTTGAGTLDLVGWTSRGGTASPWGITNYAGSTSNSLDVAGQALAVEGGISSTAGSPVLNNGAKLILGFNLSGYIDPVLTFASRNTGTGFNNNTVEWSTDGTTYSAFGSYSLTTTFALKTFDFSSISQLDNSSSVFIRINFLGATNASGNNRIDNIQLNATAVPEPTSAGLLALTGFAGLVFRRRR